MLQVCCLMFLCSFGSFDCSSDLSLFYVLVFSHSQTKSIDDFMDEMTVKLQF